MREAIVSVLEEIIINVYFYYLKRMSRMGCYYQMINPIVNGQPARAWMPPLLLTKAPRPLACTLALSILPLTI